MTFLQELAEQRWDDHRYYHHSVANQALHLMSALCFLAAYALLWVNLVAAVMLGWFIAMWARQTGHFWFEPKGYDSVNGATHEYKEAIKVGYNLRRKVVLLTLWALIPIALYNSPTFFGIFPVGHTGWKEFSNQLAVIWLGLAIGGLAFRTCQLMVTQGTQTGLVWCAKILTDPVHDVKLYYKAPLRLIQGERINPPRAA